MQFRFDQTVIRITHPDPASLMAAVEQRFAVHDGFALATLNLDHLVKLTDTVPFRAAYAAQDIVVADGNPIVWLSHLAGQPAALMPGSDMVIPLVRAAARANRKIALLGTTDSALTAAAARLIEQVPDARIAARIAPPMGFDPTSPAADQILRDLQRADIGLCLIALGAPKQEILAARGRLLAPQVGFASIGAGLDFLAGTQNRAPAWIRAIALEWAWRMLSDPRRMIPRYVACTAILPAQLLAAWRQRQP